MTAITCRLTCLEGSNIAFDVDIPPNTSTNGIQRMVEKRARILHERKCPKVLLGGKESDISEDLLVGRACYSFQFRIDGQGEEV